ncbi:formate/nitrite transporter family protein [Zunongwangia profunda]|uniref:Formate transporter n=1 Tax=Zunongwangia profunda TaxID=398743 RepID=A0A3D5J5X3_9FLAO|nr:formate/nitrite transporter family protein [Zunongwangia profunda]MAC64684.1 formate transporter [Flavobacteriaceae bacterium]HCV83397.1 formate transporter [Zunongwangia profunda]|tara:strand:- start:5045 stop:5929 length:885 start_codon:yes stop_codon:yes gene_type:complete
MKEEEIEAKEQEKKQENIDKELKDSTSLSGDSTKSHGEILKQQIVEGQETYDRTPQSILLSSITAGLEIGFSYLLLCSVFYFFSDSLQEESLFKIMAFVYPIGFIMVILGQSILFTEQTSLLTLPVLNNKRSIKSLLKIWGTVIAGNLLGGYIIAFILIWIGPKLHIFDHASIEKVAEHVTDYSSMVIFVSAILAGWLMGLLSWLITSSRDTMSRIFIIYIITATMSFTGLHHSIIGSIEVFSGMIISSKIEILDYLKFQGCALLGNSIGGGVFVALLKYRAFVYNIDMERRNY